MTIARLTLTDFRNHASATLLPGSGFVVLTGANGAGKTNILEAVSLLTPGRGLRQVPLSQMARIGGGGGFGVAAQLSDGAEIGTGTLPSAPDRRQVRINGAAASVSALSERLAMLWLTPAMDRLFSDSAGGRRRFLDRLVLALEPGHASRAARYEAAMRARNKLLADAAGADPAWLAALEAAMAEQGAALAAARARTVADLARELAAQGGEDFPAAALQLDGAAGDDDLAYRLRANRARDAAAGRATEGPHRQDLVVAHAAKGQPAALGSTGEQKALLIGIILAHAELVAKRRASPPILLLDELAAHLDPDRRTALYRRLAGRGQVWMTGTEAALFDTIEGADVSRFRLADGAVHPA